MSEQHQNPPPKRPRLSLQIKAISSGPNLRASRTIAAVVNPTSPTSFNTLSNVYATAIDRSTPVTAIDTRKPQQQQQQPPPPLKLQTQNLAPRTPYGGAPAPFVSAPETPLTAQPISPAVAGLQDAVCFPSTMTATPPLSAGPVDGSETKPFSFNTADTSAPVTTLRNSVSSSSSSSFSAAARTTPTTPQHHAATGNPTATTQQQQQQQTPYQQPHHQRRNTLPLAVARPNNASLPYVRNRSLHSILRNSPLPPPTARTPISPRRQSQRLAERAARRVCYESPIERIITTNEYVRSHIDLLLAEDSSPLSSTATAQPAAAGQALASTPSSTSPADEEATRDGGMTPGPFEEMRRRMAGLAARTPTSPVGGSPVGVRKRKRKERNRRWVWTIGNEEEEGGEDEVGGAIAALRAAARAQSGAAAGPLAVQQSVMTRGVVQSPMDIATPSIETAEDATAAAAAVVDDDDDMMADVTMSDSEVQEGSSLLAEVDPRRAISLTPSEMDVDVVATPTLPPSGKNKQSLMMAQPAVSGLARRGEEARFGGSLFNPLTGSRQDTPVPAEMVAGTTE